MWSWCCRRPACVRWMDQRRRTRLAAAGRASRCRWRSRRRRRRHPSRAAARSRFRPMSRRAVIALGVGQCLNWGVLDYAFAVLVLPVSNELGVAPWTVTGAFSLALLMSALLSPLIGTWTDCGAGVLLMEAGGWTAAALLAAWALVPGVPMLFAAWLGLGACMAATLYEPAFAIVGRAVRIRRAASRAGAGHRFRRRREHRVPAADGRPGALGRMAADGRTAVGDSCGFDGAHPCGRFRGDSARLSDCSAFHRPRAAGCRRPRVLVDARDVRVCQLCERRPHGQPRPRPWRASGEPLGRGFARRHVRADAVAGTPAAVDGRSGHVTDAIDFVSLVLQAVGLLAFWAAPSVVVTAGGLVIFAGGAGLATLARPHFMQTHFGTHASARLSGRVARWQQVARSAGPIAAAGLAACVGYGPAVGILGASFALLAFGVYR